MRRNLIRTCVLAALVILPAAGTAVAQANTPENKYKAQETTENDTPVLLMHLPEYEKVAAKATFARDLSALKAVLGARAELDVIDFSGGTEAVTATYDAGKLVIVEYTSPQASADADSKFQTAVAGNSSIVYRRIGNYNALVFDVRDPAAANALLDNVHYEKQVQWLGDAPAKPKGNGISVPQMANVLLSSVLWLVACGVLALAGGVVVGWLYWRRVKKRRATMAAFTDAGGITRLNLDGLTPEIAPERLLGE